jgi:hypothetical protein
MPVSTLVPNSTAIGIPLSKAPEHLSVSPWLSMTRQAWRWATRQPRSPFLLALPHTRPPAVSTYTMLVASDVTRHTHYMVC